MSRERRESIMFVIALAAAVVATVFTAADPTVFRIICVAVCWFAVGSWAWRATDDS